MAIHTPEQQQTDEIALTDRSDEASHARVVPAPVAVAVLAACAATWLLLRPASPGGVVAVVDLLVLPAVLLFGMRLLAGRTTLPVTGFAVILGLGAVGATLSALVVERSVQALAGVSAAQAVGPVVEMLAVCAPVVGLAMTAGRRPLPLADLTLAGLMSGLGFLLVGTSLVTAASHVAPAYVSPLLAGFQRVPAGGGSPAVFFAGPALAGALVGLAAGVSLRFRHRAWYAAPTTFALALVVFDRSVFQWRLRHFVAARPAIPSGLAGAVERLTLHGRLLPVLLVLGLAVARSMGLQRAGRHSASRMSTEVGEDGDGDEPADETSAQDPISDGEATAEAARARQDQSAPGPVQADDRPGGHDAERGLVLPAGLLRRYGLVVAFCAGMAVVVTLLARDDNLGFIQRRPVALLVALAGLAYSLWCLQGQSHPGGGPSRDLGPLGAGMGLVAVASASLGVIWSFLPTVHAARPVHGGLFVDAALGWAANVGNLGVLLAMGGFAAPAARFQRTPGGGWRGLLRLRARSGDRRVGAFRAAARAIGGGDRAQRHKRFGGRWWAQLRWPGSKSKRAGKHGAVRERTVAATERPVTLAMEPVKLTSSAQLEFVGATLKDAMEAALQHLGADFAHASLQLIDEGTPAHGKGGVTRPARVRVAETPDEDDLLLPPGRDSISRDLAVVVVVEVIGDDDAEPPGSVDVSLRVVSRGSATRTLTCQKEESSDGRARYRSNPYTVGGGEHVGRASASSTQAPAAGVRVEDGDTLEAEYRGESVGIVVYDDWVHQVVGVNRALLDVTETHHARVLDELRQLTELEGPGVGDARVSYRIQQLRTRLSYVREGRRLLATPSGQDPGTHPDAKAFFSTAILDMAMSLDDRFDDARGLDANGLDAAGVALVAHRRAVQADSAADVATGAYRSYLKETVLGRLWEHGAWSAAEVGRLLEWDRLSRVTDDPSEPPAI